MRGKIPVGCVRVAWFAMACGVACQATDRPPLDREARAAAESAASNNQEDGELTTEDAASQPAAPAAGGSSGGESGPPISSVEPGAAVGDQSSASCEGDAGACVVDGGPVPSVCVPTGPRDCTSEFDNDCDGQPDDAIDDVCVCVAGSVEACDEHQGLDGQGQCRAGSRTCLLDEATLTTSWSTCEGAVGPGDEDSCVPGDDTDCDGTPNEGCDCVEGATQPCGSNTNTGPCQIGTSTCEGGTFGQCISAVAPAPRDLCVTQGDDSNCNGVPNEGCSCINGATQPCGPDTDAGICQRGTRTCINGAFGQCVGAVFPASRNCGSPQDNDCDGRPDNTLDNICTCTIGQTQVCGEHPGQDGNGPCRAGQRRCEAGPSNSSSAFGACTGSVGPAAQDSCSIDGDDANCNGSRNDRCECIAGGGNGPCSDDPSNSRCNGQGQCVPCQGDLDCSLVSGNRNRCISGECIVPVTAARLVGTANVDPPRLPLAGEQLFVYVDDSQSGAVLTVTFTAAADDSFTIVNEINAITSTRVVASAVAGQIALTTVEAGAGVFLSVYDSAAASILGLQGLGTAEGESF